MYLVSTYLEGIKCLTYWPTQIVTTYIPKLWYLPMTICSSKIFVWGRRKKFASSTIVLLVMVRELVYYFLIELDAHASVNLHKSTSKPKNRSCWTENQTKPRPNNNRSCYLNKKKIEAPLARRIQQCGVGTPLLIIGEDMSKLDNTRFCSSEDETILILTLADGVFELNIKGQSYLRM